MKFKFYYQITKLPEKKEYILVNKKTGRKPLRKTNSKARINYLKIYIF